MDEPGAPWVRDGSPSPEEVRARLVRHRHSIDNLDAALVHLLAERFKQTKAVGELKAASAMPASDPDREGEQLARLRQLAVESELDPAFAEKLLGFILAEVIQSHLRVTGH